ncbi:hypothetical protein ACTTAL_03590 [Rhodobacter capsulatus]|uniref:hypothetical protein n=1 Tax=Rhodobacter capsulatus TaxID=1061 RepID=UPI0003D33868|nr:hypothetical protein [Rhodobacter capsulatus]ETD89926.1 hypothetical protein U713_07300 [Rhodobacter capsulatus YW2]
MTFTLTPAALAAADQVFSAVDLREILTSRAQRLEAARFALFAADTTPEDLAEAIDTLMTHGDWVDHMRADLLRAALRRRTGAADA